MTTTVHGRYQIGTHDPPELHGHEMTLRSALGFAASLADDMKRDTWVYDVMARPGQRQEWKVALGGGADVVGYRPRKGRRDKEPTDAQAIPVLESKRRQRVRGYQRRTPRADSR